MTRAALTNKKRTALADASAIAAASSATLQDFYEACYNISHPVTVSYTNNSPNPMTVSLGCSCGAVGSPNPAGPFGPGPGNVTFNITHNSVGSGHVLTVSYTINGNKSTGDTGTVNIGNPCPIRLMSLSRNEVDSPVVDRTADLFGTFEPKLGNAVVLLVEELPDPSAPGIPRPRLKFAAPAVVEINGKEGKWSHPAIKKARKGYILRVVLTKDGDVISIIRAKFE